MNVFSLPNVKRMPVRRKIQCICLAGGMLFFLFIWLSYFPKETKNPFSTKGTSSLFSGKPASMASASGSRSFLKPKSLCTQGLCQADIDSMAENMKIYFDVLSANTVQITLYNRGSRSITSGKWAVYVCMLGVFDYDHLANNPKGYVPPGGSNLKLTHINGCLYKLEPLVRFKSFASGQHIKVRFNSSFVRARTDLAPRWYVAAEGFIPKTIANTAGEDLSFVFSFNKLTWDPFRAKSLPDLGHAPYLVIPTPREIVMVDKTRKVTLSSEWRIYGQKGLENEVNCLTERLNKHLGLKLSPKNTSNTRKIIKLLLTGRNSTQQWPATAHESYDLQINHDKQAITVTGVHPIGVFYGVQTLLALINERREVAQMSIKDSPRFSYRGLMVDVGRNFMPKKDILKLLDAMAMYKMNKFHFHLTENEGWRLEIPGLKELTEVGAKRCHDLQEKGCILSLLGSGPDSSTSGTGYYSIEDYREILRKAKERHIQVIPEFDFPGHSHAAIKSMIARHDRLVKEGKESIAQEFLLSDFHDKSRYFSVQHFTDGVTNPCIPSTYRFLDHVISALVRMHGDIQPLSLYHFGGDEVAWGVWKNSPACDRFANASSKSEEEIRKELMAYFIRKVSQITHSHSLNLGGWGDSFFGGSNDVLTERSTFKNKDVYSYYWSMSDDTRKLESTLRGGYKVVLTPPDCLYLDHPQEEDFEDRGNYWAANFTDTQEVFEYSPTEHINIKNISNGVENLLGIEGSFWTETVRTADQMYRMLFPRLLAVAERAWHQASWENIVDKRLRARERTKDWVKFANSMAFKELGRLEDQLGVAYHVKPPGARIVDGKLQVKTVFPGLKVEYSTDNGLTWRDVTEKTKVNDAVLLRSRPRGKKQVSRTVKFEAPDHPKKR